LSRCSSRRPGFSDTIDYETITQIRNAWKIRKPCLIIFEISIVKTAYSALSKLSSENIDKIVVYDMISQKQAVHSKELFSFSSPNIGSFRGNRHEDWNNSSDKKYKVS
jgi:hypothetical protein